jgi:hypothetical protein
MWKLLHVKYPLFLSDFKQTWLSSTDIQKTQISTFIDIRPVGAQLFHVDGQTDMIKLIAAFRNYANAPKSV